MGIEGFDSVLSGGLQPNRVYLVEGIPGAGKTTLALQFLLEGVRRGEPVLYVTLSETAEELAMVAASHGWTLDGMRVRELMPSEQSLDPEQQYTMFHPSEVELGETTKAIVDDVGEVKPTRVVIDSLSELRLLASDALRFRRQILGLKRFFTSRACTVLLLDDLTGAKQDLHVQSIAHGVFSLEQITAEYGTDRRRLRVVKYRGTAFRGGYHDYLIRRGGIEVFPRLVAAEHRQDCGSPDVRERDPRSRHAPRRRHRSAARARSSSAAPAPANRRSPRSSRRPRRHADSGRRSSSSTRA